MRKSKPDGRLPEDTANERFIDAAQGSVKRAGSARRNRFGDDDEAIVRMLIVKVLEDAGYIALEAEDARLT